jgi:hypothetical protein
MGKKVFANGMEIAHKAGDGKVPAAFPDVCLSPPSPPAGPIPVPYPDASFASDLKEGSSTVKIGGKPAALYGKSYFKTSPLGDEAATRSFGANVITHGITGKTYFQAHSMNVKFEGKFVCRHLDITTSNHSSEPGGVPTPTPNLEKSGLDSKRDAKWGHLRGKKRYDCQGNHDWECNQAECPDCWQPSCEPNAQETQENYMNSQTGTSQERVAKGRAANQRKINLHNDPGAKVENQAIDAMAQNTIEHIAYKTHCRRCHTIGDIDIVTSDAVIEVKKSASVLDLKQMERNIAPIAAKCFPGKKIIVATPKSEVDAVAKKIANKEWLAFDITILGI